MKRILLIGALLLAACKPKIPDGLSLYAITAAFAFCPVSDCKNMQVGPSTKKMPFQSSEGVFQRWCVEVLYEKGGKSNQAAVVVQQIKPEDTFDNWSYAAPTFNADCSSH